MSNSDLSFPGGKMQDFLTPYWRSASTDSTKPALRLDRLATLYFFHPLQRSAAGSGQRRIPILMYHSITEGNSLRAHPYYETLTSPCIFAAHMRFLYENKYSAISLGDVVRHIESGEFPVQNCVVITFDDGFRDFYTHAFPTLLKYGFTATVFLPTQFVDHRRRQFKDKDCLTWNEVRDLHKAGVTFGSHTVTHAQLSSMKGEEIEYQIKCSKDTIEEQIGSPIESFSYPFAFPEHDEEFKKRLRDALRKHGYHNGVSTIIGRVRFSDDKFFLKRLPMNSYDDLPLFRAKLQGGYDWLHRLQYAAKWAKAMTNTRPA